MKPAAHRVLLAALLALAACQAAILSSDDATASLSVVVAESPDGPAAAPAPLDSVVVILTGRESRRINASPGETVRIDDLPAGTYTVRLEAYSGSVLVWDGEDTVEVTGGANATATITRTYYEHVPDVVITEPGENTIVPEGNSVTLTATAMDDEDGNLTASIEWTSSIDGSLGTGGSITTTLSAGVHTIDATVQDAGSFVGSASVSVTSAPVLLATDLCSDYPSYAIATFEDAQLEDAVRAELGVGEAALITCNQVAGVTQLFVDDASIASLVGIQNLTDLVTLHAARNSIGDIGPLSGLTNIVGLVLNDNAIDDLSPLAGLSSIDGLHVCSNSISDVSPLAGLTTLTDIRLCANPVSDIAPLAGLTNLIWLSLSDTQVNDLTELSGLVQLTDLELARDGITDIGPLSSLTSLERLDLNTNSVSDAGPLTNLTSLLELDLNENSVTDLSPLNGLTSLAHVNLNVNGITDITPLAGATALVGVGLAGNDVTNVGALQGLTALDNVALFNNVNLTDIQPLIDNTGLGSGDLVELDNTNVSCTDVAALEAKGVTVTSNCGANQPPVATIDSPAAGRWSERISITLSGSADDPEDGALSGMSLQWTSDIDGDLGSGAVVDAGPLSVGSHTITLTATDSDGAFGAEIVLIEIVPIPSGRIVYRYEDGGSGIGIMDSDGLNDGVLQCCLDYTDPDWAPDGSRVAFYGNGLSFAVDTELHLVDPDGMNFTATTLVGAEFAWNPAATDVAFTRWVAGSYYVFRADVATETAQQLTTGGSEFDPAWSPDGTQIAYEAAGAIEVINADGSGSATVLTNVGASGSPKWSPDGSRIAFDSNRGGSEDVWIMDADGSNPVQITTDPASDVKPTWSPDGEWLAFGSDRGGDRSIYVIFVGGNGAPILLDLPATTNENHPSWRD